MATTIANGNVNANLELKLAMVTIYSHSKIVQPAMYIMDTWDQSRASVLIVNVCIHLHSGGH